MLGVVLIVSTDGFVLLLSVGLLFLGYFFLVFLVIMSSNSYLFAFVPADLSPFALFLVGEYILGNKVYFDSPRLATIHIDR